MTGVEPGLGLAHIAVVTGHAAICIYSIPNTKAGIKPGIGVGVGSCTTWLREPICGGGGVKVGVGVNVDVAVGVNVGIGVGVGGAGNTGTPSVLAARVY
jgi:hypothetical protein